MATTFKQGEDKKISVAVIEGGTAIDLTTCTNIKAVVKVSNTEMKKYSLQEETDNGKLDVDQTETNKVNIFIEREESKNFPTGNITIILLCAFPNTDFVDGIEVREFKFSIGRVVLGE